MTSQTFRNGEGHEGLSALTKVSSGIVHAIIMDPDPVRFVSSRMTYVAGVQGADVCEASIDLSVETPGLVEPDSLGIVLTLLDTVIEVAFMGAVVNVRDKMIMCIAHGSGFKA